MSSVVHCPCGSLLRLLLLLPIPFSSPFSYSPSSHSLTHTHSLTLVSMNMAVMAGAFTLCPSEVRTPLITQLRPSLFSVFQDITPILSVFFYGCDGGDEKRRE